MTSPADTRTLDLSAIDKRHVIEDPEYHEGPRHCDTCWEDWPCDTRLLLDAHLAQGEQVRALLEALAAMFAATSYMLRWAVGDEPDFTDKDVVLVKRALKLARPFWDPELASAALTPDAQPGAGEARDE